MTSETTPLADKILRVTTTLTEGAIPFAFGGAIARNYYAEPRLTLDLDIGIFLSPEAYPQVLAVFSTLFPLTDAAAVAQIIQRDAQVRLSWDYTPVDLFFSYDPFHAVSALRIRRVPFADVEIPILAVEDVILHKLLFNRPKDWRDIADMLYAQRDAVDRGYIQEWLAYFLPADEATQEPDTRVRLFGELMEAMQRYGGTERE